MSQTMRQDGEMHYEIREVVGLFPNAGELETAVEQLGIVGFDRAAISVLAAAAQRNGQNAWLQTATAVADDPSVTRAAFMSHASRVELRAICVAGPALFGGFAAAWAAVAYGGDMSWEIISTAIAAAAGAGLGLLLLRVAVHRRSADVQRQLAAGWPGALGEHARRRFRAKRACGAAELCCYCGARPPRSRLMGREGRAFAQCATRSFLRKCRGIICHRGNEYVA